MDRALVPGYSKLGYAVRRRWWKDLEAGSLDGKVVLVTGANSGLGRATVEGLVKIGATVHMVVRSRAKGEAAAADIDGDVVVDECDVSDFASIRGYAAEAPAKIHALIHNAGVLPPERTETADGNETAFATHVLGPHLLTELLLPALKADGDSRVIFVTSGGMYAQKLATDDLQYERGDFDGTTAYARTKRMQVVLAEQWAERLAGSGVVVNSTHPGWADTPGLAESLTTFHKYARPILRDLDQGSDTTVWLAAAAEAGPVTGKLWHDRAPRPTHYVPWTRETADDRRALWRAVEELTHPTP
jgi:NAD(P)-dependent dehydrogenase (short-subunit alcohol dehydrogenase family)